MVRTEGRRGVFASHPALLATRAGGKKLIFYVDRKTICEYRYTCNGPLVECESSASRFVIIPSSQEGLRFGRSV